MKVKRPNVFLYFVAFMLYYPVLKVRYRLKIDKKDLKLPKGPHIILANHKTMIDFLMVMLPLYPHRLNAITAYKYFLYKPLHKLLPMAGCIPKNMFDPDVRSIVGIKTVLKRGDGILLFPEGRCSTSGEYVGISKATGKLIKKLGVPVYSCLIEGAYICTPHWRKGSRYGRTRVTYKSLFTENDLESLSIDEVNAAIDARLSGDEGISPSKKPIQTLRANRLAEGLHKILYWCPKCKSEYTTETESNTIRCTACGNAATMDREAKLTPVNSSKIQEDISLWYRDQVQHEKRFLSEDMEPILENVKVKTPAPKPGGGMVESGSGIMRLSPMGWHFDGEISGEQVSLLFPVETVPAMSYDHNSNFQIYNEGDYYQFIPEDKRKCIKYVILAECMHRKFSQRISMTPGKNSGFV